MRHLLLYLFAATKHPHKYCSNLSNPTIISSRFAARKVVSARRCATAKATRTLTYHRYTTRRDLAASLDENEPSTLLDSNDDDDDNSSLTNRLRQAFQVGQTDGVLQHFATTTSPFSAEGSTATMWVQACIEAADGHKGTAVSMLNACLGAIVVDSRQGDKGSLSARRLAADMLTCLEVDYNIKPDMLTYALVYSACQQNQNDNNNNTLAANVLDKAQRLAKKLAGSSRRKALAAARRKAVRSADDAQDALQALLGEDFAVLAEMNDYVVVNKPSGTVCHHNHATTAGKIGKKNADVSLVDALLHVNVPLSTMNAQAQGLVHRLDRGMFVTCWLWKPQAPFGHYCDCSTGVSGDFSRCLP